jgi:hypothetical protein
VDDGEPVEHPQHAVEQRRQVGVRLELLHVLLLEDLPERRPARKRSDAKSSWLRQPHLPFLDSSEGGGGLGLHRGEEEAEGDDIADDANDVAGGVGGNHLAIELWEEERTKEWRD